ncbi:CIC11C00000004552 [Sungouiella intermedia]|uniref:CIC11C00000004552 n=1 Tax=Sungouiella intermedia TaxID=45354 RepID=A0A1L0D602_9ASCO|nr:CIC11C00000004552 [[Candida] intermedia]
MSSEKNYLLEVSMDDGKNLVTFTVKARPSRFYKYVRIPLASVLIAYLLPQMYKVLQQSRTSAYEISRLFKLDIFTVERFDQSHSVVLFLVGFSVVVLLSLQEQSDSLMVMEDMGIQLSSRKRWRFDNRGSNKEFIPRSDIIDIVIHEGFHGYGQVIFYMCILTKAQERSGSEGNGIKVVFPNFLPRKDILLQVWKLSRKMLYGETRRHFRRVPGQGLREVKHLHE